MKYHWQSFFFQKLPFTLVLTNLMQEREHLLQVLLTNHTYSTQYFNFLSPAPEIYHTVYAHSLASDWTKEEENRRDIGKKDT